MSKLASKVATAPRRHDNDYPLWQGPCGMGPLGGITQSMLVRFLSCRERFRLKYVLGLVPHDKWHHTFGYGNMWHVCEEAYAKVDPTAWLAALALHFNEQHAQYPYQREEITKWFNVCRVQFPEYVKYWSSHPDVVNRTPLMQEQVFDVPYTLPSGRVVRLRSKLDSVDLIRDKTGLRDQAEAGIYLQENKTKGDVDKLQIERQLKFDLQTMMYLIVLHAAPLSIYGDNLDKVRNNTPIRGVRYNVIKRDCPIKQHQGRQLKAGWKEGETVEHWMERLRTEYYGAKPAEYFFRVRAEVSARDIQVFRQTCLDPLLENLCWWYDEITWKVGANHTEWKKSARYARLHYRTPFGVYSALEESGATEYDSYLETGSETGLRRVEELFTELK